VEGEVVMQAAIAPYAPCKICGTAAALYGVVDFNKSCEERAGTFLPLLGIPVYYRRCASCAFLFTEFCDGWTQEQFRERIYNDDYVKVDPDYASARPTANARMLARTFAASKSRLVVLDYGSGAGALAAQLRDAGFGAAASYDPFSNPDPSALAGRYDVVTCFEVLEHHTSPGAAVREIAAVLKPEGLVVLSTLVQGAEFERERMNWWYIGPRNGHVSIFSRSALAMVWGSAGFRLGSMNDDLHVAFRSVPDFAESIFAKV
jgi:SAM-dependent methyltransferase